MDELGSKLRKLFKPKPKVFKGKGNILGRADQVGGFAWFDLPMTTVLQ